MTINQSDQQFFNIAEKAKAELIQSSSQPPTIKEIRASTSAFKQFLDNDYACDYKTIEIETTDHMTVKARFIDTGCPTPLLIFLPGTGFMHPIFDENFTIAAKLSHLTQLNTLMLEYRLAPEFPYPKPLEDAKAMMAYISQNQEQLKIKNNQMILSGFSSGANLAAVLSNTYKDDKKFNIIHQYLFSGGFEYTNSLHDFDEFVEQDKMLDEDSAKMSFDLYCGDANRKDPLCSPYWQKDFANLPPTTIQCGEFDGGRSQSEGYYEKLSNAGCQVEKIVVSGQTHFTILYRKACSDGEDPAAIAASKINNAC
ncbi:MAG: alpha/beta hydrolase fold domain-containing protein [Coxiellaceae bacterium]|nr:alpha/beta hydrolase fold domain-containing protein [Coxiellaceae bacterium]